MFVVASPPFMLRMTVLLLLATSLRAGEIDDAVKGLSAPDVASRKSAIKALVGLDTRRSLDVLIQALRVAYKDDPAKQRAFRKIVEKWTNAIEAITRELEEARQRGETDMARLQKGTEVVTAAAKRVTEASEAIRPHLTILTEGTAALASFKSAEARERVEELATHERPGRLRTACLRALIATSSPAMVPTFLELAADRDPRIRAIVVRALRRHVGEQGVLEKLDVSSRDTCWQVRRGAYLAITVAPAERAVPILEPARARETGDQLRLLDRLLHGLGKGEAPAAPEPVFLGLPLTSTRVRFVLDTSSEMKGSIEEARTGLERALDALPDGATFEIVACSARVSFSPAPERATAATRERAKQWLRSLRPPRKADASRLFDPLAPDYEGEDGAAVFENLPDAVYVIFHEARGEGPLLDLQRFAAWNTCCDTTFHARAFGAEYPRAEMEELAGKTGGTFVAGK